MTAQLELALTGIERGDLKRCEAVIERGRRAFVEVGLALIEIRERRLYRESHGTFEDYLSERWEISRPQGYRLMDAAAAVQSLSPMGDVLLPQNERQARPLTRLEPELQPEAWTRAVEDADGQQPTGAQVTRAVEEIIRERPESVRPSIMASGHSDEFGTDPAALVPLYPFLPREWTVWECAPGQGMLADALRRRQAGVIAERQDFLTWEPEAWDCIVTNPPYAPKDQFLERAYALGKPFAFLMRDAVFDSAFRRTLFRRHGVQLILPEGRTDFTTPNGTVGGAWFYVFWVCWGLGLPREINFSEEE